MPSLRRTRAALALLVAAPLLAACGVAHDTTNQTPSGNGSSATVGSIQLRGITLVTAAGGVPAAELIGAMVNTGTEADSLTSITITQPTGATATITGALGSIPLPPQSRVLLGQGTQIGQAAVQVDTPAQEIKVTNLTIAPTAYAQVVFTFQKAGTVTVPTMAVQPFGIYAGYGPLS